MSRPIYRFAIGLSLAAVASAAAAQRPAPLQEGQSQTGRISEDSEMMSENIYYLDTYQVAGEAGERIEIVMRSDEFDTFLEIGQMVDGSFMQMASDDDGAGELNSRLVYTFPESGDYLVRARTFGPGATGTYLIEANRLPPPPPPPPPTPLARGQSVEGSLSVESPSYEVDTYGGSPRYYDLYSVTGDAGDTATVTLRSADFDSYLEAGGMTPLGFAVVTSNDDGAATGEEEEPLGLDSRLTITFQEAGTVVLRATSLGGGSTGAYTLSVE